MVTKKILADIMYSDKSDYEKAIKLVDCLYNWFDIDLENFCENTKTINYIIENFFMGVLDSRGCTNILDYFIYCISEPRNYTVGFPNKFEQLAFYFSKHGFLETNALINRLIEQTTCFDSKVRYETKASVMNTILSAENYLISLEDWLLLDSTEHVTFIDYYITYPFYFSYEIIEHESFKKHWFNEQIEFEGNLKMNLLEIVNNKQKFINAVELLKRYTTLNIFVSKLSDKDCSELHYSDVYNFKNGQDLRTFVEDLHEYPHRNSDLKLAVDYKFHGHNFSITAVPNSDVFWEGV